MKLPQPWRGVLAVVLLVVASVALFSTRDRWSDLLSQATDKPDTAETPLSVEEPKVLKLTPQARKNLGLVAKPAKPESYWRKIQIPGTVVDRPGRSDRGVTSPAVGIVTEVHAFPGDTVKPGDRLFTLRLFSEYLQNTQKEFFGATRETQLIEERMNRIRPLVDRGAVSKSEFIELENQLRRQAAVLQAHRQDLLTRGLNPEQIESVADGSFVSTVDVVAPPIAKREEKSLTMEAAILTNSEPVQGLAYEVQSLNAELGQQVQAGQLLSTLADHSALYIEGHAFKREAPYLETAAQKGWQVTVEFAEDEPEHWPALMQQFQIRYLSNSIDTESRTFDFFIPLANQSRAYEKNGETFVVWRFRPGQRVRLHVPVEEMSDVLVLPSAAVVREGPEAFVFQQNGDLFNRIPVQVLHEDRLNIVLANDGSVLPGFYLAQGSAASLNRVLKAQAASGMRADVHVHADGTVHASH